MKKNQRQKRWLMMLFVMLASSAAQAEFERWTDDNGVIYYRNLESPAPEKATPPPASKSKRKAASIRPSAIAKNERKAAQQRRKAREKAQARKEKRCARLQKKLDNIQQKLDDGYREPKGNTLRRQRREVQSQMFRECR